MEPEKIERISELTQISKNRPLTEAEQAERAALRKEYLEGFRANMEQVLGNVLIRETDGTLHPLEKKDENRCRFFKSSKTSIN